MHDGAGIELKGLARTFRTPHGPVEAVRGVDVAIARGETVALLGPNGAGKSTTIDMLLGLLPPDRGSALLFGRPPRQAVADGAVSAMLQTGSLIRDLSVRELAAMVASLYPSPLAVDEVLELTGTGPLAVQRTQKLSGGDTQRVRFALALVADPELLVLDEPTVAMDVEGRRAFWTTMREVAEALPSYWLVQAGRIGVGGTGRGTTGWIVVAAWAVGLAAAARWAYRRDTARV